MAGTIHEEEEAFFIPRAILLRLRNVLCKSLGNNQNTFCVLFFFLENRVVYEVWKNTAEPEGHR